MLIKTLALAGLASLATATSAMAVVYSTYHGTFTVNAVNDVNSSSIAVGDQFYFQITIDPFAQDVEGSLGYGYWPAGLTEFKMGKIAGSGAWNPTDLSYGSMEAYSDPLTLTTQFETWTSFDEGIDYSRWDDTPDTARYFNVYLYFTKAHNDTGTEQTIPGMFGNLDGTTVTAKLGVDHTEVTFTTSSFQAGEYVAAVPEASSSLLFLGSVAIGLSRRKRK